MRRFLTILALALFTLVGGTLLFSPGPARAQMAQMIRVKVGSITTVLLGARPKEVSVENTELATVEILEDGKVRITGLAKGYTTLVGTAADGSELIMPILVEARK